MGVTPFLNQNFQIRETIAKQHTTNRTINKLLIVKAPGN